ncbi:MAG: hypothetical protein EBZ50_01970 [Alphaproteobacteria bacterium]|nr:hypothetical protein [Alphaproteobacteria bacterium]
MLLLHRVIALVLLALWLPATSHCAIETVLGVVNEHCGAVCSHDDLDTTGHPTNDACATVEDGAIKPALAALHAPMPSLAVFACLRLVQAALLAEARPLALPRWRAGNPEGLAPARHFVLRAAPLSRAPSMAD